MASVFLALVLVASVSPALPSPAPPHVDDLVAQAPDPDDAEPPAPLEEGNVTGRDDEETGAEAAPDDLTPQAPAAPTTPSAPQPPLPAPDDPAVPRGWPTGLAAAAGCGVLGGVPLVAATVLTVMGGFFLALAYLVCPCYAIQAVLYLAGAGAVGVVAGPLAGAGACAGAGAMSIWNHRFWQGLVGALPGFLLGLTGSLVLLSTLVFASEEIGRDTLRLDDNTRTAIAVGTLSVGMLAAFLAGPVGVLGALVGDLVLPGGEPTTTTATTTTGRPGAAPGSPRARVAGAFVPEQQAERPLDAYAF